MSNFALAAAAKSGGITWQEWSPAIFEKAKAESKLVILDLEAVWCHWCHVMEAKTYSDARVRELIGKHFIAVRVDQDERPDLSKRYEDYGWPATIFFDASGRELAKRSGNVPPKRMITLLEALIADPSPEEPGETSVTTVPDSPFLGEALRTTLQKRHLDQYDVKKGGWGRVHKFLFGDTEELALRSAWSRDERQAVYVKETLANNLALIDGAWGGVYQYSVQGWSEPHFEKVAENQARNLLLYSLAYMLWSDESHLHAAQEIRRFLNGFLKAADGGYYTSQDADLVKGVHSEGYFALSDSERRKQGLPAIDTHRYSRENGWFIAGLAMLYAASGDGAVLADAVEAARWVEANRSLPGGGFSHDAKDAGGPYLGDTLEMGLAFLKLYEVTAERAWLGKAANALDFIANTFSYSVGGKAAGFVTAAGVMGPGLMPLPARDENIRVARFANLMSHYTGSKDHRRLAEQAMRFLAVEDVARQLPTGGVLLADRELGSAPVHLTIVGAKSDSRALALYKAALRYPTSYRRVEWHDAKEGKLPNHDVEYPSTLPRPAAFACTDGRCSLPIFEASALRKKIDKLFE